MKPLNSLAMWESIKNTVETDDWVSYFNKNESLPLINRLIKNWLNNG
jgi:hypothetical protein